MDVNDMRTALKQASETDHAAEQLANDLAKYVERHLRGVSGFRLARLKMALRDFDARGKRWRDE